MKNYYKFAHYIGVIIDLHGVLFWKWDMIEIIICIHEYYQNWIQLDVKQQEQLQFIFYQNCLH